MRTYIHVVGPINPDDAIAELYVRKELPGDFRVQFIDHDSDVTQVTATVGGMTREEQDANQQAKVSVLELIGLGLVQIIPNATVVVKHDRGIFTEFRSEYTPRTPPPKSPALRTPRVEQFHFHTCYDFCIW